MPRRSLISFYVQAALSQCASNPEHDYNIVYGDSTQTIFDYAVLKNPDVIRDAFKKSAVNLVYSDDSAVITCEYSY